jgi:hypothetical protein
MKNIRNQNFERKIFILKVGIQDQLDFIIQMQKIIRRKSKVRFSIMILFPNFSNDIAILRAKYPENKYLACRCIFY